MAVNAIDGTKKKLGTLEKKATTASNSMINSFKRVGPAIAATFSVGLLVRFSGELVELGNRVIGVENAFNRMNRRDLLDNLREATRGTIDDLKLMQAAVFSEKFRIPMEVLAKGMEFAGLVAVETGEDFEYMMRSFVTGTARESVKILDNLGISAKALREEVEITGDFMTALENVMDRELAKMRGNLDETILRTKQLNVELKNHQQLIAVEVAEGWNTALGAASQYFVSGIRHMGAFATLFGKFFEDGVSFGEAFEDYVLDAARLAGLHAGELNYMSQTRDMTLAMLNKSRLIHNEKFKIVELVEEELTGTKNLNKEYRELAINMDEIITRGSNMPIPQIEMDVSGMGMQEVYQMQMDMSTEVTNLELANLMLRQNATVSMFNNMAGAAMMFYTASGNASKTWFGVYKAMAITQTAIATYQAAVEAYKSMVGIPVVGPGLAVAAAAAATAFGLGNIARIASMQPGGGFGGIPSAPSLPSGGITNNNTTNNQSRQLTVNIYHQGNIDPDEYARLIIPHIEKAYGDGAGR